MEVKEASVAYADLSAALPVTVPPECKRTELGTLPEDWASLSIQQIAARRSNAIVGGPFGSDLVSKDYVAVGVPVVRGQNMAGHYVSGDFVFVSRLKAKRLEANLARPGDIVFTQRGTLGQVALVPRGQFDEYVISQSQMKLTLSSDAASAEYVYQYFISAEGQKQVFESAIQTGVPHTNLSILRGYRVPIPATKAEQVAIAEALSDADALIESLAQLITKKRQIKQGAMQQLLTGKQRLPGYIGIWEVKRLGDVFSISAGKSKSAYITAGGAYWIVDMGSVSTDGMLIVSKATNHYGDFLRVGDLVMPKDDIGGGGIIGKVGYIDADDTYVLGDHVYRLVTNQGDSLFLSHQINAYQTNSELRKKVIGSAQLGLGRKSVEDQEILFPPREEQTAIAGILGDMDTELAELETRLTKTRQLKQGMMQALLTGAIRLPLASNA